MGRKQGDKEESCRDVGPQADLSDVDCLRQSVTRDVPVRRRRTERRTVFAKGKQARHASPCHLWHDRHQGPLAGRRHDNTHAGRRHAKTQRYQEYEGKQSHHGYSPSP
jgi:hypothetical protein